MKSNNEILNFDHIVIGSGLAGLTTALHLGKTGRKVAVITKRAVDECNSRLAQGGVACVMDALDTFDEHVKDTLVAGAGLCNEKNVRAIVEAGPEAVRNIIELGAQFTTRGDLGFENEKDAYDLGREGGHHKRRVLHAGDITGAELERVMVESVRKLPNVIIFEHHTAIDLVMPVFRASGNQRKCFGVYVLNNLSGKILTVLAPTTVIASGGAGKVYLYTSNPDIACGSGVAMAYRAGAKIANMEFIQFHPTILHHEKIRSFLISEALRGEGAVLKSAEKRDSEPVEFMHKYHPMKSLAPRDVVARSIDHELKIRGEEFVYLDVTHMPAEETKHHFPNIYEKCLSIGIDITKDMIPVCPAAHYCCGGVKVDYNGESSIRHLYVLGESSCTGLHGANRLASNSLTEAFVYSNIAANHALAKLDKVDFQEGIPDWDFEGTAEAEEMVLVMQDRKELRSIMSNYVGIVRSNLRLDRALKRLAVIWQETEELYNRTKPCRELCELRNMIAVAYLTIKQARECKESVGLHYTIDYPPQK